MKKLILFIALLFSFAFRSYSQAQRVVGPVEQRVTDSICNALSHIDFSKIQSGEEANTAFMECFTKFSPMLEDLANERKVEMDDENAMHQIGVDIGKNLLRQKCDGFIKLAGIIAQSKKGNATGAAGNTTGKFKRIDNKGFNYVVIVDDNNLEQSFLWLRQFKGSKNFMNGGAAYAGKNVKVAYKEIEVYVPEAKGYYMVKEITDITEL